MPLESSVRLVFLPDVTENKKYFFLKHLNLYFCVFMIPCMPLQISEANILKIFSFQTKKKKKSPWTIPSSMNPPAASELRKGCGDGRQHSAALHSKSLRGHPARLQSQAWRVWPSSQQVGHLGPALPSGCLLWTCPFISLSHGFLICGIYGPF